MKSFEEYFTEGIVRKNQPDIERSKNLAEEAKRKMGLLEKNIQKNSVNEENANDYVEYCYNILMFQIRSKMYKEGYVSSDQGSHEAEVAFTVKLKFLESETIFLDKLRYFRNGILYYGKRFDEEYAEKVIEYTKRIIKKIQ